MSTTTTSTTTTTGVDPVPRGPVDVELTFYEAPADGSTPYNYVESPPAGVPRSNYGEKVHKVSLTDIRGHEADYTLDTHAFQVLQHIPTSTTYSTFDSDAEVQRVYYPEVEQLLLQHIPGAQRIILFDHTIRRQDPNAPRQPVNKAHVDQTRKAARDRVRLHVTDPDEAERIISQGVRYRIVNVWRPLNGRVESSPLAFAAASSVDNENDLVAVEHRYPHRTGETMAVKYNPNQRWMYLSGMENEERLLLKCSDSLAAAAAEAGQEGGIAERVPHSAFWDPRTREGAKPRESIEVRALVIG
ncbi:hypothetical protein ALT_1494 [Aspergillus lentulus]|uniref:Methyltransferase n=1 Tax=Aspergillus lentulus TaxID=293939 RepID=A0AAN5YJN0_ASPLE|nr:hypothetical protein CNMCM6069_002514 [Aspergillus lentulus]KAF4162100.1 hypothetical protein CNMCM6936_002582 [Aspergillus lentulus]KAF4178671.1 hypothetical protein CNMCM7927_002396 [Aspergillus lentulus]KAF4202358.1 hypothetical protein CNMCM8927_000305 [Aspergillus lentulus]GAQ04173.1 hypothetical protein ALT_1494 [Aspergillus lentulus]